MANVKTAVSIYKALFEQANALAREMKISRSRVFALALEEYIQRHENQKLLDQINRAYADAPDESERKQQRAMRRKQRKLAEGEW
jgi:metal-responsive CopG/Arc/MetJ family transcriptional regulator